MANLKETIISSMANGPEVLLDRAIMRRNGHDYSSDRFQTKNVIDKIHPQKLNLKVIEITEATSIAKTIRLVSTNGYLPVFQAGQYINIFAEIDGIRTSRPYSISSSPKQRAYYEITVARIPEGFVSDYFLDTVKVGDIFEANGPSGVFHFNPIFHSKKSVFLGGGSGITPFMSMITEILENGMDREIHLIYGSRKEDIAIFHDELSALSKKHPNFKYDLVLSEPETNYKGKTGLLDDKCIKGLVGNVGDYTFYLCGPQIMTDFCVKALETLKVARNHIRREVFGSRKDIQNEEGWPTELTGDEVFKLTVGDKVIDAKSNESILTSLERASVRVNVCCRSGECSLCRVKLIGGKVFMPRGVALRLADGKFGYIHSCKAYPNSDIELRL